MRGLYERVLEEVARGAALPTPRPPRPSASVVLWRRAATGVEVFWIERAPSLPFMGGFHAFPGGGISRADGAVVVSGRPRGIDDASVEAAMPEAVLDGVDLEPNLIPGLLAGTVRELFEETGLLLARRLIDQREEAARLEARLSRARLDLEARRLRFDELLSALELTIEVDELVYAGRWLTPPLGPLRFDNRFFLLEWPPERPQQPRVVSGEAVGGEWIRPSDALCRWRQGEITTAPPILHTLRVLDEQGAETGLDRLREPWEANAGPYRWIEFRPGVALFPLKTPTLPPAGFTNCYLLGMDEAVLVDPGSPWPGEIDRLAAALEAVRSSRGRRVSAIWLTHHHPDHIGGVEELRRRLEVPVAAHRETAAHLRSLGIPVDDELEDGRVHDLAGDATFPVRTVFTPGHARGHLCFYDETYGSLLAGDLVAGVGTIVIDPPEGDMAQYLASLARVRDLAPRALFPAHGPITVTAATKLQETIDHRRWREARILDAWRSGIRQPEALCAAAYDDIPAVARPLAARQVQAHLEHLGAAGELED